jgi:flagellar biogenesis protein FliO
MSGRIAPLAVRPAKPDLGSKARAWWERILRLGRRPPRRLRLCESLPLGERRFVAVVEFEQSRFLLGGTSASLVLLARLSPSPETQSEKQRIGMSGEEQP